MNLNNEAQLGEEAKSLINNPAYIVAMERMQAEVIKAWKDCPIRDQEGQLLFLQLAKLTDKFQAILHGMIENGKFAQNKINLDNVRNESGLKRVIRKVL